MKLGGNSSKKSQCLMGFHVIHYKDDSQDQEQALRILIYIWSIPKIAETPFQSSLVPWWWVNLKKGYVIYMKYKTKCEILQLLLWLVCTKNRKEKREMGHLFQKIGKCESENMCTREIDWFVIVVVNKQSLS